MRQYIDNVKAPSTFYLIKSKISRIRIKLYTKP